MQIQINSDNNIVIDKRKKEYFSSMIEKSLNRFDGITRIEVHLSDENSEKSGTDDKRCLLEVRMNNRQPIVVTNQSDTLEKSISGSLDKIKSKIDTILGKLRNS
ncbi:HPF/RaiA family ribosome-associated protein [Planktosalinus lacus]|uniref:Ribosomal subunit interface protein n=1 Tax=Planktosalinus lacus TaxID=1526573 RepID=A0A8J2V814_9FLAO|nr:HPF/RaiA family ribosome-associated protein [Planktosalinus lacus]GGD82519.1 hypothetical protein GCM10011312_03430 [Planktosalinus lacus]